MMYPEIPELYDAARRTMHSLGFAWTDPRTRREYPPPCGAHAERVIVRHVERAAVDDADPVAHTAFYLLGCVACRTVAAFPASNLALITPSARRALHLELARAGWWLPWLP
jgi:hypothetical protein